MFDKEAEEYFNKTYNDVMIRNKNTVIKAFKDGAEFGYNKANEAILRAEKAEERLTKAKEHIKTLMSCLIDWVQEGDKDYCYIAEAEQFLEEV